MRSIVKRGIVLLSVLSAMQASAGELPDTPSGRRAGEIISLLNGESSLDIDDYIENQYSPDFRDAFPIATHKSIFQSTQAMFGRLKVAAISKSGPEEISLVLKAENSSPARAKM